jgi:two-component system chemotaxis response regulator CheY
MLDVLIVDDSAAIRKILQRVLRQTDLPIGQIIGLILSDINMPNMDGLEFLGQLKASPAWTKIPVIMVSTEGSQAKVLEAVERGAVGYVRKPFTADQIKEKLAGFLSK